MHQQRVLGGPLAAPSRAAGARLGAPVPAQRCPAHGSSALPAWRHGSSGVRLPAPSRAGGPGGGATPPSPATAAAPSNTGAGATATAPPPAKGGAAGSAAGGAAGGSSSGAAGPNGSNGVNGRTVAGTSVKAGPSSPVSFDMAMAAKITAARELARRLAEEKAAAAAAAGGGKAQDPESKRAAEVASAEAAAQAAKADALVRALRRADSSRAAAAAAAASASPAAAAAVVADAGARAAAGPAAAAAMGNAEAVALARLRAENEALRELLLEVAADKEVAKARLEQAVERAKQAAAAAGGAAARAAVAAPPAAKAPVAAAAAPPVAAPAKPAADEAEESVAGIVAASAQVAESIAPSKTAAAPTPATSAAMESVDVVAVKEVISSVIQQQHKEATAEDTVKAVANKVEKAQGVAAAAAAAAAPPAPPAVEVPPAPAPAAAVKAAAAAPAPVKEVAVEVAPEAAPAAAAVPEPSLSELRAMTQKAAAAGKLVFTWPPEGARPGQPVRLYYNRARGPLPPTSLVQLKAGLNRWEEIVVVDMERVAGIETGASQEWWAVGLLPPAQLFRLDFVLMDGTAPGGPGSGAVDNNGWKDYELPLVGAPTEEQVMEQRAEAYRRFDEERLKLIEEEEKRLWRTVESRALDAAAAARVEFRRGRDAELLAAAQQVVADRRKADITAVPAATSRPGVYAWCGGAPRAGSRAFLAYNKVHGSSGGGLPHASSVRAHVGYDGWWNKITQVVDLSPLPPDELARYGLSSSGGAQWWGAWLDVPYSAAVLNFVFSDREQRVWDNNGQRDFHTLVAGAHSGDELVEMLHAAMKRDSAEADKEVEDRAALRAVRKVEAKGLTMRKRREVVHEFLYTAPLSPKAGGKVDVYYRPEATMLRGRPEIWVRATWNRMGAAAGNAAGGWARPVVERLVPCLPGGLGFFKATVQVPREAWGMDLCFADSESMAASGFVDDNGGLDYHVPIEGAATPRRTLSVVHVAVEMAPIAKVGGMGDVVTALGRAVLEQGHGVQVIVPKYDCINYDLVENLRQLSSFNWGGTTVRVWRGVVEGLDTTFLEPENGMFWVGCIYGRNNDAQRFGFFCGAALQYLKNTGKQYDIIHCHDWQSAPIAWGDRGAAKAVFTIHNLSYGADLIGRAMQACSVATTVSPTYAREIAGHPSVAAHLSKLYGVLNGIDQDIWDPSEDPCLPQHYAPDTVAQGKEAARRALRDRLGLAHSDVPIVGCVTRLVAQKGIHLIKHAAWRTLERGGQFVLLGSAPDGRVQGEFNALRDQLARTYPDRAALVFTYDEPLSHLIYAGSDMFLVPSMFEPCGLTQMIAMRYGTIPVVRKTGGLVDTVYDVDHDEDRARQKGMETNGFSFEGTDFAGMDYALNRALSVWYSDKGLWQSLRRRAMQQDWSWNSPALDYIELYYKALRS